MSSGGGSKVLCLRNATLLKQATAVILRLTGSRQLPPCSAGNVLTNKRYYKSMPTHGIGRYKYLLPKEVVRKKKDKIQMKEVKLGSKTMYGSLNISVNGFNLTLVEHYNQYIHKLCNQLQIKVEESYAMPTKSTEISLLQEQGTKTYLEATITSHERIIQVSGLSSTLAPILLEVLNMNQPEGIQLSIREPTVADFNSRFKSRPELDGLMAQMS